MYIEEKYDEMKRKWKWKEMPGLPMYAAAVREWVNSVDVGGRSLQMGAWRNASFCSSYSQEEEEEEEGGGFGVGGVLKGRGSIVKMVVCWGYIIKFGPKTKAGRG